MKIKLEHGCIFKTKCLKKAVPYLHKYMLSQWSSTKNKWLRILVKANQLSNRHNGEGYLKINRYPPPKKQNKKTKEEKIYR